MIIDVFLQISYYQSFWKCSDMKKMKCIINIILVISFLFSGTDAVWANRRDENVGSATEETNAVNYGSGILVTWSSVEGATGYIIYRRAMRKKDSEWTAFARWNNTTSLSFLDTKVYEGTKYQYSIRAYYGDDPLTNEQLGPEGPITDVLIYSKKPDITDMTTTTNVDDGILVEWAEVEGATGYIVYRRAWNATSEGWSQFNRMSATETLSWTDTTVYAGTRYQYGIKAYYGSDPQNMTYVGAVGPLSKNVRVTSRKVFALTREGNTITIQWMPSKVFTGYEIQYSTNSEFDQFDTLKISNWRVSSETLTVSEEIGSYYFRLRSYHELNNATYYGAWAYASIHESAEYPDRVVTQQFALVNGEKVYVLDVEDNGSYLFLPAETDTSCIKLYSDNGDQILFVDGDDMLDEINISDYLGIISNVFEADYIVVTDDDNQDLSEIRHLNIMKGANIGTVYYHSDDAENNGIEWVETDRNNRGTGTACITDSTGEIIYNGKIDDIHIRGNLSLQDPKKGYQIKLSKKTALVGKEKGKKWVLLAMYKDPLRISDLVMKYIANISNDKYSAHETLVNLYYDGQYRGLYCLSEKNEVKSNRIDITDMEEYYEEQDPEYGENIDLAIGKNKYNNEFQYQNGLVGPSELGGYLLEMNNLYMDDSCGFFFTGNGFKRYVSVDSPEYGSKEAIEYISEYFQEFVDAVYGSQDEKIGWNPNTELYYYDYCDMESLINTYLIQTIASNNDAFWKSQYFYKDVNGKMYSGPTWDMDMSFGTAWSYQTNPREDTVRSQAISGGLINIPGFRTRLKERYFEHYQSLLSSLLGENDIIPSFMEFYNIAKENLLMDTILWPAKCKSGNGIMQWDPAESLDTIVEYRIEWIRSHKDFLDTYFANME